MSSNISRLSNNLLIFFFSLMKILFILLSVLYIGLRCCKLDLLGIDANFWEDLESKMIESIRNTLDKRVQFYEDELRKLSEQRFMPVWNFCNFFILKVI